MDAKTHQKALDAMRRRRDEAEGKIALMGNLLAESERLTEELRAYAHRTGSREAAADLAACEKAVEEGRHIYHWSVIAANGMLDMVEKHVHDAAARDLLDW